MIAILLHLLYKISGVTVSSHQKSTVHSILKFVFFEIQNKAIRPVLSSPVAYIIFSMTYQWIPCHIEIFLPITVLVDLLASQIFGESVSNRCWRYFNLAKSCSCYTYNSNEAILASFKFGRRTKNRQTAKLKSSPNILWIRYVQYF